MERLEAMGLEKEARTTEREETAERERGNDVTDCYGMAAGLEMKP